MPGMKKKVVCATALSILVGVLVVCSGGNDAEDGGPVTVPDSLQTKKASGLYTLQIEGIPLYVEIAQDPASLEEGLMFRQKLPEDHGMLFVFPYPQELSFWMRNTYIALDIAFIDEAGVIVDIQHMAPIDESQHYVSRSSALYALEVNGGWFERHRITVGARVVF
jgi:uncharacterized membrane protein (UPF0127 family)